jgi:hypothetical protein
MFITLADVLYVGLAAVAAGTLGFMCFMAWRADRQTRTMRRGVGS